MVVDPWARPRPLRRVTSAGTAMGVLPSQKRGMRQELRSLFHRDLPGGRAICGRPLALRPRLAAGVPFSGMNSECGPARRKRRSWSAWSQSERAPRSFSTFRADQPPFLRTCRRIEARRPGVSHFRHVATPAQSAVIAKSRRRLAEEHRFRRGSVSRRLDSRTGRWGCPSHCSSMDLAGVARTRGQLGRGGPWRAGAGAPCPAPVGVPASVFAPASVHAHPELDSPGGAGFVLRLDGEGLSGGDRDGVSQIAAGPGVAYLALDCGFCAVHHHCECCGRVAGGRVHVELIDGPADGPFRCNRRFRGAPADFAHAHEVFATDRFGVRPTHNEAAR